MSIVLNTDDRKTISTQMLRLPILVESAQDTAVTLGDIEAQLLLDDADIKIFYDFYNLNINRYQNERRWIDGVESTLVLESQIQTAAQKIDGNLYFPEDWRHFNPFLDSPSNLQGTPTSSQSNSETEITSNIDSDLGLDFLINAIINGLAGSGSDAMANYDGANTLTIDTGPLSGPYCVIGSNLLKILSVDMTGLIFTVEPILPASATSGTVTGGAPAYNNTQRNALSGPEQPYLDALSDAIISRATDWETSVQNQITNLTNNTDNRSLQETEISTALLNAQNGLIIIQDWLALPDTGTLGNDSKFTDNNLDDVENLISNRQAFNSTRISQISTALGSLSQNASTGDTTGSGLYLLRYEQLNNRINIIAGPLSEYYEKGEAIRALEEIADVKGNQLTTFESVLLVTALVKNGKNSTVIEVVDNTGFSVSDTVYVVSDTQTEIQAEIVQINGVKLVLDVIIPDTFTIADKARLLKVL